MRRLALAAVFLLACPIALAQMLCHAVSGPGAISPCEKKLTTKPSSAFQKVYWPALMDKLTEEKNPGLKFFREGLTQYYGLNYEEAMHNFEAAKKDPSLSAMASWGIALAAGPNINLNMTDACHCVAKKEIKRAACLAGVDATIDLCPKDSDTKEACTPAGSVTQLEKDLIEALKQRYDYKVPEESKKHAEAYRDAMAAIWKDHPKDKNVSTLYAESMMNLNPWDLYDAAGLPKREETRTIVGVLKGSTGDSLEAIGANHYYIHAVEGSNPYKGEIHPIDALPSANLLQTQVPDSGHLVHMSSHIYLLLGKYQDSPQGPWINGYKKSLDVNIKGADNDVAQYGGACSGPYVNYTESHTCPQLYYGHYLSHNYFFGSVSATFLGQSKKAIALACDTQTHTQRFVAYEPGLQRYLSAPFMTLVVNRNWDALCDKDCQAETTLPPSPTFENCYTQGHGDPDCHILRSIWYWARGTARVAQRKDADGYLNAMINEIKQIPDCKESSRASNNTFGNNCARDVLNIGKTMLEARIVWADKSKSLDDPDCKVSATDVDKTFEYLRCAVALEDKLLYDEPPQWFTPAREALGGAYLQNDMDKEAVTVFKAALLVHPASGRALFGLMRALKGQMTKLQFDKQWKEADKLSAETSTARNDFCEAWHDADYTMTYADLWPPRSKNPKEGYDEPTCSGVKIKKPSTCTCPATVWPPPQTAVDIPANDDAFLTCK